MKFHVSGEFIAVVKLVFNRMMMSILFQTRAQH